MLCCIICRPTPHQEVGNIPKQSFVYRKVLIKYNKANAITPMKTHIDDTHVHLITKRKLKVIAIVATKQFDTDHNRQPGKKRAAPFGFVVTRFFGSTNLYKDHDET
jgi:hypothetical protein